MDKLNKIQEQAVEKLFSNIEDLIAEHLPKNYDMDDIEWKPNSVIKGATTLHYREEPILSLFQSDFKVIEEDGITKLKIEQLYFLHKD